MNSTTGHSRGCHVHVQQLPGGRVQGGGPLCRRGFWSPDPRARTHLAAHAPWTTDPGTHGIMTVAKDRDSGLSFPAGLSPSEAEPAFLTHRLCQDPSEAAPLGSAVGPEAQSHGSLRAGTGQSLTHSLQGPELFQNQGHQQPASRCCPEQSSPTPPHKCLKPLGSWFPAGSVWVSLGGESIYFLPSVRLLRARASPAGSGWRLWHQAHPGTF